MADGHPHPPASRAPRFDEKERPRTSAHADTLLDQHGAGSIGGNGGLGGKDAAGKDSNKLQNHFSAIPGLKNRSIKGCVPRICQLKVTKIEALSQLTSSKTYLKLVVVMSDGRSRLRDSANAMRVSAANAMRVTRAALSSSLIPIHASETFSLPLNMQFFMQYFHNMKASSDSIRILLQKGKKRPLVNKTIAECTLSLADVLQNPLEDGSTLILHSTGRLKRAQPAVSAPLLRVHAQLESVSLDMAEVAKWWPEDDTQNSIDSTSIENHQDDKDQGVFSGEASEEDDPASDLEGRSDDDEWVETREPVLAVMDELGAEGVGLGGEGDSEKEKFGKVFRSKVLSGTRKIASITLNPVRAVRNGYARIRNKKGGRVDGQEEGAGEPSALDWSSEEEDGYGTT